MRRLVAAVDQLSAWRFVLTALVLLAAVKAWWMSAQLARNPGASELGGLLLLAASVGVSIFAIRRRQTGVWDAAAQVIIAIAGANLLSYILLIPFLPPGSSDEIARLVRAGVGETLVGVGLAIPVQAAGLWLSRRFGTHSPVTERRSVFGGRRHVKRPGTVDRRPTNEPDAHQGDPAPTHGSEPSPESG